MKPQRKISGVHHSAEVPGTLNAAWLQDQVRAFVHDNDLTIVERGKSGQRSIVMAWEQVFELGATLLLACGHNVR